MIVFRQLNKLRKEISSAFEIIDTMAKNNDILTHSLSFYKTKLAEKVATITDVQTKLCSKCENKLSEITSTLGK